MKISGIDANLLIALDALLRERSVTRAARRIGVTQPALSHSLARLREHFKDPLLIAKGRELLLSDKAARLLAPVAQATAAFSVVFEERPGLDLNTARAFVIASGDLFAQRFVPEICGTLRHDAPGIEIEVRTLAARSTEAILSDGVDLAFGVFEDVPASINQEQLFRDPFVCVVRTDHPKVGATLSLKAYAALEHLEVVPAPNARPGLRIDRALAAKGAERAVTLRVPYYLLAARLLATSDHVLTMTRTFAEQLTATEALRIVKCPLPLAPLSFSQIWARRYDADPTHHFLRETCARHCALADRSH